MFGTTCKFVDSFGYPCEEKPQMGDKYCHEHLGEECSVCGSQAVKACSREGPVGGPCGFRLCGKDTCRNEHAKKWHK